MKTRLLLAVPLLALAACSAEYSASDEADATPAKTPTPTPTPTTAPAAPQVKVASLKGERLELGCGKCTYDLAGADGCCAAAVVNGSPVLMHGDRADELAHAFCGGPQFASVSGDVGPDGLTVTEVKLEDG